MIMLHLVGHWKFSRVSIILYKMFFSFLKSFLLEYFTEDINISDVLRQLFSDLQN